LRTHHFPELLLHLIVEMLDHFGVLHDFFHDFNGAPVSAGHFAHQRCKRVRDVAFFLHGEMLREYQPRHGQENGNRRDHECRIDDVCVRNGNCVDAARQGC
jgi:hypothetical protein